MRDRICFTPPGGQEVCFYVPVLVMRDFDPRPDPWIAGLDPRFAHDLQVVASARALAAAASPAVVRALEPGLRAATEALSKQLPRGMSYHPGLPARVTAVAS